MDWAYASLRALFTVLLIFNAEIQLQAGTFCHPWRDEPLLTSTTQHGTGGHTEVVVAYAERKIVRPVYDASYLRSDVEETSNLGRRPRARGRGCRRSHFGRRDWCIRFSFCIYQLVIGWHGT